MTGVRHAEQPKQAVNVDLCFVPAEHKEAEAVPAVSGSSGRLVVSAPKVAEPERTWPGRVFERQDVSYSQAMDEYVAAREKAQAAKAEVAEVAAEDSRGQEATKAERQALRTETQRLQIARRQERARRQAIDRAWKARKREHQAAEAALEAIEEPGEQRRRNKSKERAAKKAALKAQGRAEWAERHRDLKERREEDVRWQESRESLRVQASGIAAVTVWIAVLVIVDNCTRQSPGLPLFTLGPHVTADLVVAALEELLPKELKYLIADGGTHFVAQAMKDLAKNRGFVRVPLARHRPQSNGIAERFIETLKDWLADKKWHTAEELATLLAEFLVYYNDRPHQGHELAGLSPNEYAARKAAA